jgi:hypothetical protein
MEQTPAAPEHLLSIPAIAEALEILSDASKHVTDIALGSDLTGEGPEEYSHARFYAEDGLRNARIVLQETILELTLEGTLSYDQALGLLRQYEFECDESSSNDFSELLAALSHGSEIYIKNSLFSAEGPVHGTIVGEPMLAPYTDSNSSVVRPVILIDVLAEGIVDGEVLSIRRGRASGEPVLGGVIIGSDEIEKYLAEKSS